MDLMANDKMVLLMRLVNQLDKAGKLSDIASFIRKRFTVENHKVQLVSVKVLLFHIRQRWPQIKSPAIAF